MACEYGVLFQTVTFATLHSLSPMLLFGRILFFLLLSQPGPICSWAHDQPGDARLLFTRQPYLRASGVPGPGQISLSLLEEAPLGSEVVDVGAILAVWQADDRRHQMYPETAKTVSRIRSALTNRSAKSSSSIGSDQSGPANRGSQAFETNSQHSAGLGSSGGVNRNFQFFNCDLASRYFSIDSQTGRVCVAQRIDRDSLCPAVPRCCPSNHEVEAYLMNEAGAMQQTETATTAETSLRHQRFPPFSMAGLYGRPKFIFVCK
ncbi:unnamed protein product [Protopolystoma xenopodis]|uniref:Cadherin N-terminal domain-containing protein n=1 Tax=Protopolystoma xenopodis TaxID=117903 RepID=A0A448XMD6_9PLAT|nr:unnamed protein product [Protopolystoma xenopodis]